MGKAFFDGKTMFDAIRGLILDLDGTLTRPKQIDFAEIRREIGCPMHHSILEHLDMLKRIDHPRWRRALAVVDSHEKKAAGTALPAEGLDRFMTWLRATSLKRAILTRNSSASTALTLRRLNLSHDFDPIISRELAPPKPHPDGIRLILHTWDMKPDHALMIGDHIDDIRAGRAAGTHTLLCTPEPERSGREPVCTAISTLAELPGLLDPIRRPPPPQRR